MIERKLIHIDQIKNIFLNIRRSLSGFMSRFLENYFCVSDCRGFEYFTSKVSLESGTE